MKKPKTSTLQAIHRHHHSAAGFTLVEILVAMVISLFLIGGVVQLFIQNKTSYKLQEGIARAQENGRLSLYFIEKNVRRAGYPWDGKGTIVGFQRDWAPSNPFTPTDDATPIENGTSDRLVMQYKAPPNGAADCTGRDIDADEHIAMHFLIDGGGLKCETSTTDSDHTTLGSAVLINDVTDLQLTYGVDSDNDGIPDGVYSDADVVTAADKWLQVVAVHAEVTVTVEPVALSNNATMVFATTIPIRNQISSL